MKIVSLKHKKEIGTIFTKKAFNIYDDRIKLRAIESKETKIMISVPNRLLKRAVDRNRVKRLIREVLRTNEITKNYNISFIYNIDYVVELGEIKESIDNLLKKLNRK
jgi:ribonuclease P protein component